MITTPIPIVSICCITYNHEKYIRDTLEGFVTQKTNFPFEIVISDDCSKDNTKSIIAEYKDKYPNLLRDVCPEHNIGVIANFQHVLERAEGKYIAFCEGDDYWVDALKLQKQVDFMESHHDVGLCYTDYNRQLDVDEIIPSMYERQKQYRPETYEQHLLRPGYLAPMTWLFRKELLAYIDNSRIFTDGTYLYMLEFLHNSKIAYLPIVTATYRAHVGSASAPANVDKMFKYMKGVFNTQRYYADKYPCSDALKVKIMIRGYLDILPIAIKADQDDFVKEAHTYMESQGIDIHLIIRDLKQGEMRKRSKAYRLGKSLLKPLKWIKE